MNAAPEQNKILHIVGTRPQYVKLFPSLFECTKSR